MNVHTDKKDWSEYMRWITPILVTLCLFFLTQINAKVDEIDTKLFKHLTNDDMHTPRSVVVDKETFALYQVMRDKQMGDLRDGLNTRIDSLRTSMDRIIEKLDSKYLDNRR